jgi:YD repeat-containing protein
LAAAALRGALRVLFVAAAFLVATAHADTVQYVYDELGRLIATVEASGGVRFYNYDAAGNLLSVTSSSSSQIAILTFTPGYGIAGNSVTIVGSGFVADPSQNTVRFGGTQASVSSATSNTLVASVPVGAVTGAITVANTNGTATSARPFVIVAAPTITAATPSIVSRGLITRVDLSGSELAFASAVTFAQPGITATILPGATRQLLPIDLTVSGSVPTGSYAFSVTNPAGTSNSGGVVVTIAVSPLGPGLSAAAPLSVFAPPNARTAPSGADLAVARPASVFAPRAAQTAPSGDNLAIASPASVFVPGASQVAPSEAITTVAAPVSVSAPQ